MKKGSDLVRCNLNVCGVEHRAVQRFSRNSFRDFCLTLLILLVCFFLPASRLSAQMVYYVDEQGKVRYVNIETTKVPDKYLPQVREQLQQVSKEQQAIQAANEVKRQAALVPSANPPKKSGAAGTKVPSPNLVEIFVKIDCPECDRWEETLRQNRVPFVRYDVNYHPHGVEVYRKVSGNLPFTMIGNALIFGEDIDKVLSLLKSSQNEQPLETEEMADP